MPLEMDKSILHPHFKYDLKRLGVEPIVTQSDTKA